jgi:acetolactate synthase-1/2/3 large subunit
MHVEKERLRTMERTGAQIIVELLQRHGITIVPGIPGGANLPIYDALFDSGIRHVLARHEQGAGFIAQGMARSTGRPQVFLATSGPGATNAVTALADAKLDSVPLICITGQVASALIGTDAFQEIDTFGMTLPITKHNFLVKSAQELLQVIPRAFEIAGSGRPGPVLVDVPKDVQLQSVEFAAWPTHGDAARRAKAAGTRNTPEAERPDPRAPTEAAAELMNRSQRPVLLLGGGVIQAGACELARRCAEKASIPCAMTLMGLGALPQDHPLSLGMLGMHGSRATNMVLDECDLLVCIGGRFDDRATGAAGQFCPGAKIIHVDVDPSEFGKIKRPDLAVQADASRFLSGLLPLLRHAEAKPWLARVRSLQRKLIEPPQTLGQEIVRCAAEATAGEAIVATDVGQHQMWAAQAFPFERARQWLTSGGLGTMGFGIPAAIGAALACPTRPVLCFTGDGSALMNIQELPTLAETGAQVKIILLDNNSLGLVRQQQTLFYESRLHASDFQLAPDFVAMARACGLAATDFGGSWAARREEFAAKLREPGPALIRIQIPREELVLPMVAPGGPNTEMITGSGGALSVAEMAPGG